MDENKALADKLAPLCKDLAQQVEALRTATDGPLDLDSKTRSSIVKVAQDIIHASRPPYAQFSDHYVIFSETAVQRTFLKWDAFDKIPLEGSISFADLAAAIDADVFLTSRMVRMLISTGFLLEPEKNHVAHTPRSSIFVTDKGFSALMKINLYDEFVKPLAKPEYFETYGRKEPVDKAHSPYAFGVGAPGKTIWEIWQSRPGMMATFIQGMKGANGFMNIHGVYDFSWIATEGAKHSPERVLLIDVGGGSGHTLKYILSTVPELPKSQCMLQDLPVVVDAAEKANDPELEGVQFLGMDFHASQPVQGALVYYIQRCLHDYDDDESKKILQHIADVMAADSKLLIGEMVLAPDSPPFFYGVDLHMMAVSGKERSVEDWEMIVASVGLRIEKIHFGTSLSVVECVKV
ncbi:S-adenosyl-L-methionine-dependent methyltransferase [Podospora appendiculata]|uniref:S-adenosyl-L-methionine-dependent methyltransferase n=1 Tax=Podospora appendiculata TaxID=314037 RepID=A0AAE1C7J3_9PEZI|nr:S-adenosyl-L-methionine-dependent methyltransferase [Podospora appendiculata]